MSKWVVDIHGDIEGDYDIIKKYDESKTDLLNKIRAEIEQLPTKTRINWDGICPDPYYPEIEYIDVTKKYLLKIIDKYKLESEDKE